MKSKSTLLEHPSGFGNKNRKKNLVRIPKKILIIKNLHLIISIMIVFPAAIIYGFKSNLIFNVTINSLDEATIFKAIMGVYLAFSILWCIGIFNVNYWKIATFCNMFFMLGLAFGRIISLLMDGFPTTIFVLGTIGELILGFYAWRQLKNEILI
jgi:hypothetical protein